MTLPPMLRSRSHQVSFKAPAYGATPSWTYPNFVGLLLTGFSFAVRASMCPATIATPFPGLYAFPTVKAMMELPFRVTKYLPPGSSLPDQSSRVGSLVGSIHISRLDSASASPSTRRVTYLFVTNSSRLSFKVLYRVEYGWVLPQEVTERFGKGLGGRIRERACLALAIYCDYIIA